MPLPTQTAAPVMGEDAQPAAPAGNGPAGGPPADGQGQTVEVPAAACEGCKPGDTVQFKVVSIDEQGGVANLVRLPYGGGEGGEDEAGGSDAMASQFSKDNMSKAQM